MTALRGTSERRHSLCKGVEVWNTFYRGENPEPFTEGFGSLVLLDEMRLSPGARTEPHPGDESETVTYVLKGALSQEDSTGNLGVIHAGEFQHMSMGHRIRHKETNASLSDWAHVFRIALLPSEVGLGCTHKEKRFTAAQRRSVLCVVASPDGRNGSLRIHQDAFVYSSLLDTGQHIVYELLPGRKAWLHIVSGSATVNGIGLTGGDGTGIADEPSVSLTVQENTELLLVDTVADVRRYRCPVETPD